MIDQKQWGLGYDRGYKEGVVIGAIMGMFITVATSFMTAVIILSLKN